MKINYFGITACILSFASLLLPWFTIVLWTNNLSSTMNFVASLFQLTGTVEGITKSFFLVVWFNVGAFVLMLIAGLMCLVASIFIKKCRWMIFISSFILILAAIGVFGYGLISSNYAVEDINPGYAINQFPEGSFSLSADESMLYSYDYSWTMGIGFWLAVVSAILILLATILSRRNTKNL